MTKTNNKQWKKCSTCGGMYKDITDTEIGQGLKNVIEKEPMTKRTSKNHPLLCEEDHILKKRIKKTDICRSDEVIVFKGWFSRLYQIAQKFEKDPNDLNKAMLLGYISSAEFIVDNL